MKTKFNLIDGNFSVAEAGDIAGNLLEFKIQYQRKQNFGSKIRTSLSEQMPLSRKENLKTTKKSFLRYLRNLSSTDIFTIHSEISIKK
jgi:hypothetical protein